MAIVLRSIAGIVAGMIVAIVLLVAVERFSAAVHPVPPDFQGTMDEMCRHVARYPHWVLALVVPAWAGAAFAATWTAGRIGNSRCALVIGLLLIAALVFNVSKLPYALWFKLTILLAVPLAVVLAVRWSTRRVKVATEGESKR